MRYQYLNEEPLLSDFLLYEYQALIIGLIWEKMRSDLIGIFKYILIVNNISVTFNQLKKV